MSPLWSEVKERRASLVASRGDVNVAFPRHFGAVGDAGENVCFLQSRILQENFGGRHAAGEQVKHQRHPEAMSPNARLSKADARIDRDSRKQFFTRHGSIKCMFCVSLHTIQHTQNRRNTRQEGVTTPRFLRCVLSFRGSTDS